MATILSNVLLFILLFLSLSICSDAQYEDYCIADEQYTDEELMYAMKWACSNGADCSALQEYQPCFFPNTTKDHASFAFNSYYQNTKHIGGSCYFIAAALLTALNPSHDSCIFAYIPNPYEAYHYHSDIRIANCGALISCPSRYNKNVVAVVGCGY